MAIENFDNHQPRKIENPRKEVIKHQENASENLIFVFAASQGFSKQIWDKKTLHSWLAFSSIVKPNICVSNRRKDERKRSYPNKADCSQENLCIEHRILFGLTALIHQMDLNLLTGEIQPPPNVYPFGSRNGDSSSFSDEDEAS
ncbi:hypothetical protein TcWFU_005380 [Taenia crassiceps]|uniref:Uncharacterized protein n=1 Tax=Taenia crassiceps TaxID=6207 RepID=A0ABR4QHR4_9CEST